MVNKQTMRYFFIIISLVLFNQCKTKDSTNEVSEQKESDSVTLTAEQIQNAGIETGMMTRALLNAELKVNGIVDVPPQNIISVSFPMGGYLKSTGLLPGMHVSRGEVIAVMEDPQLVQIQQDYLMANAKLDFLAREFDRQKMLNENNVNSDKVFQQTSADYNSQKILVKGLAQKLLIIGIKPEKLTEETISRTVAIYSPINGFVSKVNVNIGKYVTPSDVLFELINPDDVHAALTIFEKDLSKVKPKQKVVVNFVDNPSVDYDCEVLIVTKNVDDNRSALAHCHFETKPKQLLPGMYITGRIKISDALVDVLPEEAVVRFGNMEYVLEETGKDSFRMVEVKTGIKDKDMVEIMDQSPGLTGKKVVVRNAYAVLSMIKNSGE